MCFAHHNWALRMPDTRREKDNRSAGRVRTIRWPRGVGYNIKGKRTGRDLSAVSFNIRFTTVGRGRRKKSKMCQKNRLIKPDSFEANHVTPLNEPLVFRLCEGNHRWASFHYLFLHSPPVPKMSPLGILSPGFLWSSGLSLPPLSCNLWGITLWSTHSPPRCLRTVTAYNNCHAN